MWVLLGLIVGIVMVIILVAVVIVLRKRGMMQQKETNYKAFFVIGVGLLPVGIVLMLAVGIFFVYLVGLAVSYMAIGLVNRDKWK
ncbi:MAG: hypothetical protein AYK23_04895 [Candidatus Proteinoplasmatales archaeon SG8-5]|nr:MAG: hypothetical protein AYK23_04895 [Candidatus Proteinoplasmatales archaeon SG8-5]